VVINKGKDGMANYFVKTSKEEVAVWCREGKKPNQVIRRICRVQSWSLKLAWSHGEADEHIVNASNCAVFLCSKLDGF
jgi:ribosomal protein S12